MWAADLTTQINGPVKKAWEVLVTPGLWTSVDPKHYKEVTYSEDKLKVGVKGKMKSEDSPGAFGFNPTVIDVTKYKLVTESNIPAGKLTITKRLVPASSGFRIEEQVTATGPFSKLFAKLFFEKQIKGTLPAQHAAIKKYVEA
jgi:hypothetical protein